MRPKESIERYQPGYRLTKNCDQIDVIARYVLQGGCIEMARKEVETAQLRER